MSTSLTLYRKNGACSFAAHALLIELNIPFQEVELVMDDKGMTSANGNFTHEEYKKIHPDGYVPALNIDGDILTELPAVLSYISSLSPERRLEGGTRNDRAKVLQWLSWLSGKLHGQGFAMLWRPGRFTEEAEAYTRVQAQGLKIILECAGRIEQSIAGKTAIGDRLTLVDFVLYTFYRWISLAVLPDGKAEAQLPRYAALAKSVEGMDTVKETLAKEKLAPLFRH